MSHRAAVFRQGMLLEGNKERMKLLLAVNIATFFV